MKLSESDFIFFVGGLIGLLAGPVLVIGFTYGYFFANDGTLSLKMYLLVVVIIIAGLIPSYTHVKECLRKLKI